MPPWSGVGAAEALGLGAALGSWVGAAGAGVTVSGADAVMLGDAEAATRVCSPASVAAGTVTVAVKDPSSPAVAVPTSTGSECSVSVTGLFGAKPVPLTVRDLPASTVEGSTVSAGVARESAETVTDVTVVSLPNPFSA